MAHLVGLFRGGRAKVLEQLDDKVLEQLDDEADENLPPPKAKRGREFKADGEWSDLMEKEQKTASSLNVDDLLKAFQRIDAPALRSDWERSFHASVCKQIGERRRLTEKQLSIIERMVTSTPGAW